MSRIPALAARIFYITWSIVLPAQAFGADELKTELNIVYCKRENVELKLDLFRPDRQSDRLPGVLVIHGGAWRAGSKEVMRPIAEQLARAGYVAASVQYRLCPKFKFPAQIEDVQCAVRWMRTHAQQYGIDAERIGALGASAGGHLALMLGAIDRIDGIDANAGRAEPSSKVQAVVNYFGPVDLTLSDWDPRHESLLIDFLGGTLRERRKQYVAASPWTYLDEKDAPVITFHGTMDPIVPYGQAVLLDRTLREKGVPSQLEVMIGSGHGWLGKDLERTQKLAIAFLDEHLKPTGE